MKSANAIGKHHSHLHLGRVVEALLLCTLFMTGFLRAQDNTQFTQGTVNDSATLSLGVPLRTYEGRGIDLPVSLTYSSSVWRLDHYAKMFNPATGALHNVTEARFSEHAVAGWKTSLDLPRVEFPKSDEAYNYFGRSGSPCNGWRIPRVTIYMPSGETYQLRKGDLPVYGTIDRSGTYYAVDGTRVKFESVDEDTWTLWLPDGSRYYYNGGSAQVIDRHGNTMVYNGGTRIWTDTLGRLIPNPLPATPAVGETDYYLPGLNGGTLHYKFKWELLANALTESSAQLRRTSQRYWNGGGFPQYQAPHEPGFLFLDATGYDIDEGQPHPLFTAVVGQGEVYGAVFNPVVLTEIILPDNSKYQFSYNVYGEIDKVIYPTNAFERYEYESPEVDTTDDLVKAGQPYVQAERRIKTRGVSESGAETGVIEWEFEHERWEGITTVTAPDGTYSKTGKSVSIPTLNQNFGYESLPTGTVLWKKAFSSTGALLRREVFDYESTANPFSATTATTCTNGMNTISGTAYRNTRPVKTASLIFETGSSSAISQVTTFTYDETHEMTTGVDQTGVHTYHYTVLDALVAANIPIGEIALGNLAKTTETIYSTNPAYRETKHILGVPTVVKIKNASGTVVSQSEMVYDECPQYCTAAGLALPTSMRTWDSTKGSDPNNPTNHLVTHAKFDQWGNRTEATDAMGFVTTTVYDTTYQAFPIQVISPVPDPTPSENPDQLPHGSQTAFTTSTTYDTPAANQPPLGLVIATTDANNQTTTISYVDPVTGLVDPLLRPRKVTAPNGHQTITEYGAGTSEATRWVKVRTQIDNEKWSEAISKYDGLGRTYLTEKIDSQGNIFTETEYDTMGRVKRSTNPYKTGETKLWTTPEYDDLSRTKKVVSPDTDDVQILYGLSIAGAVGTTKTITDQAGKKRMGITDALGNMVRVIEDPDGQNLATDYVFDTLGNLRKTIQGEQSRYFMYDSLGRVLFAKQPEQDTNSAFAATDPITNNTAWSVRYSYDDNGNILTTTDARNISITGTYDRFNRLKTRDYSDSTPDVSFYYDGIYLNTSDVPQMATGSVKGKTTGVKSSVSRSNNIAFDAMGRLLTSQQITDGQTYSFGYTYNLSGALIEETYPSGRVVKNTLNADGELSQVQSGKCLDAAPGTSATCTNRAGFFTYADSFAYNSAGAVTKMQLGNGRWETAQFNERLQITQIGLGVTSGDQNLLKLEFKYNTTGQTDNNGSMREQKITVPAVGSNPGFTAVQTYAYDSLNRIQSATENVNGNPTPSWKQTFDIDRYGNRRFDPANTTTRPGCDPSVCNPEINTSDNRLKKDQVGGSSVDYDYDANGALLKDFDGKRFGYDAESHQKEFFSASNQTTTPDATYHYDGEGRRVKKVVGTEVTIFVYDASGQLAAEYSTTVAPVEQAKVSYLTTDHLGSPRIITDQNGAVISRKDFAAFGDEVTSSQRVGGINGNGYDPANVRQDYTGYQKDNESGLEFAQARYYNTDHGRFTSVDPLTASATIRNPQTFNRYSYVMNSPYKFTDPLGLMPGGCGADRGNCGNGGGIGSAHISEGLARHDGYLAESFRAIQLQKEAQDAADGGDYDRMWEIIDESEGLIDAEFNEGTVTAEATVNSLSVILVVGEPGKDEHNLGSNLLRAASLRVQELAQQGFQGLIRSVNSIQGFQDALDAAVQTIVPVVGIEVFAHGDWNEVFLGQESGADTNISFDNVTSLKNQSQTLQYLRLNSCFTGANSNGIAARLANQLNLKVEAFSGATIFSQRPDRITHRGAFPSSGPAYLIADGGYIRTFPKPRS